MTSKIIEFYTTEELHKAVKDSYLYGRRINSYSGWKKWCKDNGIDVHDRHSIMTDDIEIAIKYQGKMSQLTILSHLL